MSNATCPNCGATQIVGARFCRQCGRLIGSANAASVAEATTRALRTPAEFGAQPTEFFTPQPTSPAYLAPDQTPLPPSYATSNLEQRAQKRKGWLIALMVGLFLLSILSIGIISFIKSRTPATQPPVVTTPKTPRATIPEPPISPPPPAPPAAPADSKSISRAFIYPGAEVVMDMTRDDGGSLLQLRTTDSYAKVLDWYVEKLKPRNTIKTPGPSSILKSDKLMAIITSEGSETMIMLKGLDADDDDNDDEP